MARLQREATAQAQAEAEAEAEAAKATPALAFPPSLAFFLALLHKEEISQMSFTFVKYKERERERERAESLNIQESVLLFACFLSSFR